MDWISILRNARDTRTGGGVFVLTLAALLLGPFLVIYLLHSLVRFLNWVANLALSFVADVLALPWSGILSVMVVIGLGIAAVLALALVMVGWEQHVERKARLRRFRNWRQTAPEVEVRRDTVRSFRSRFTR